MVKYSRLEGKYISTRKGLGRTLLILGSLALLGFFVVPKLPQLMAASGLTGSFSAGAIQPLEIGQPRLDDIDLGSNGLSFIFEVPVENPNPYPAQVDRITYDAYVDDEKVAEGNIPGGNTIPAKGSEEIRDRVNADMTESFAAGAGVFANTITGETSYLELDGKLHMDVGPGSVEVPFNQRSAIN